MNSEDDYRQNHKNRSTNNRTQIKIGLLNVQGLITKARNKLTEMDFKELVKDLDILLLTETWTNDTSEITLDGYDVSVLNRVRHRNARRDSGGIAILFNHDLCEDIKVVKKDGDDIMWIKINGSLLSSTQNMYICLTYVLPKGSSRIAHVTENVFDRIMLHMAEFEENEQGNCNFLIAGDCNAHTKCTPDWVENDDSYNENYVPLPELYKPDDQFAVRLNRDKKAMCKNGLQLIDFCKMTGVRILNGRVGKDKDVGDFTYYDRHGGSVIDYMMLSQEMFTSVQEFEILDPVSFSDHCMLKLGLGKEMIACNNSTDVTTDDNHNDQTTKRLKWQDNLQQQFMNRIRHDLFRGKIEEAVNKCEQNIADINETVNNITVALLDATPDEMFKINHHHNNNLVKDRPPEWMCDVCKEKRRDFLTSVQFLKSNNNPGNRQNMIQKRQFYNMHKKKCISAFRTEKTIEFTNAKNQNSANIWKMLGKKQMKTPNISVENYYEFFKNLSQPKDVDVNVDNDIKAYNQMYNSGEMKIMFESLNRDISSDEVRACIKKLKLDKASGNDMLVNEMFIVGEDILLPYIVRLFNCILLSGFFPESWSQGVIVPIHKSGTINDVHNYRGITLLSIFGKMFTSVLNMRLTSWAEQYRVYIEGQAGFREGYSTIDNLFVLQCCISKLLEMGKKLYCCFIDYKKAFDFINYDCLWFKLLKLGIRGHIIDIIKSMYSNVSSIVRDPRTKALSGAFTCSLGVRQGESLSPFLFAMYVNDLEDKLFEKGVDALDVYDMKLFLLLYADDAVLLSDSAKGLQKSLDILHDYCVRWKLYLNTDKTKVIVFRRGGRLAKREKWKFDNKNLEVVKYIKYLGVIFSQTGSFRQSCTSISDKAKKATFALLKKTNNFPFLSPSILYDLYVKTVVPVMCYGCEIWGFSNVEAIERAHLWFLKLILKVKSTTMTEMVYTELATFPLYITFYTRIIAYWIRILKAKDHRYIKQIYLSMVEERNEANWATNVKNLLYRYGFGYVWERQEVVHKKSFLKSFKARLQDNYIQIVCEKLRNGSKARLYRSLNLTHEIPFYMNNVNPKLRHFLTKLRLGSHRLISETGSWARPVIVYADRKCSSCNVLGDEFHHVLECKTYDSLREKYVPIYYRRNMSMYNFTKLLLTKDRKILNNLCIFLQKSFKLLL